MQRNGVEATGGADSSSDSAVLYELRESGVAVVTLNRPERLNAWGDGLASALYERLDAAELDEAVRVIVLTGRGRAFCAGADMGELDSIGNASSSAGIDVSVLVGERFPSFVTTMRKPVIAAINGACAGIGLVQALMCDVRFAAAGAKMTTAFAQRGLTAEYGVSWILPRLVGWGPALDLMLSGRTFYAEEAAELGMVKEVVAPDDLMARTLEYADAMAVSCAPSSLAVIKRQMYSDALRDLDEISARAEKLMQASMLRPDFIEGITAFFEKRRPDFPPLAATSGAPISDAREPGTAKLRTAQTTSHFDR
ncbi:enoyl-CoA hydratase [Mycolicibacterium celeriflavum]|uniref:Enoyl-CoA hydratase n=1 Tax=Mycolicibacterium celeriflavum TaxID=1249101 RepID=A0A7I7RPD4_MYCCF|nr:enoyl-CoA hydratase [Mycolicibacterium celeriflavum]MCV7236655.1 enoyl-CoA hydratase [Mycolicibacterium celeriflavum]BBY46367.1 enoyl-CoA hydratase [Mycolicibacterium celeriflavum]